MSAKDYTLAVTPLTNTVWITKTSKKNPNLMTNDRAKVDESVFIGAILQWIDNKLDEGEDTLSITEGGKVVAELKINRKLLGLDESDSEPDPETADQ